MSEPHPPTAMELTLDDAWAGDLVERHSRLHRVLAPDILCDVAEAGEITIDTLGPVFDAVREFELVRRAGRLRASDDARLFEALVYRLGRYLFGNSRHRALQAHDLLLPRHRDPGAPGQHPVGDAYGGRLELVKARDEEEDPEGVWRDEVAAALDDLNREEAVHEYSEVGRTGRLLCFCAALWILEVRRSPDAATVALDDRYRRSLSGEPVALYFRARGLLVSPVISAAQAQLGLQFVTAALLTYPRNPGMHHTKALFLLRQSALTEIESISRACLDQARDSVEAAVAADAEFAPFYATRAKIEHRLGDASRALTDLRAAVELARYSAAGPAVDADIRGWEDLLDRWQLTPLRRGADR